MDLRDVGASLPPGFKFHPSDEELVCHYLFKKVANEKTLKGTLVEIDLHTCEPWQLPEVAKLNNHEWYFFSFRDRKYATGFRTNRATQSGYWKATGKDRLVHDPMTQSIVGMRKTLVFYQNRAPNGIKTGWIMHEFRLENPNLPPKEDWVLCRVFYKSQSGEIVDVAASLLSDKTIIPSTDPIKIMEVNSTSLQFLPYQQHQINTGFIGEIANLKSEDEYNYLFGSGFRENSSGDHHNDQNLGKYLFDSCFSESSSVDHHNDNNLGGTRFAYEDHY